MTFNSVDEFAVGVMPGQVAAPQQPQGSNFSPGLTARGIKTAAPGVFSTGLTAPAASYGAAGVPVPVLKGSLASVPAAPGTAASALSTAAPFVGGALAGAGIGAAAASLTGGKTTGGTAGGAIGGTIGTAILPGIGTVVGSVLGGLAGAMFGAGDANITSEFTSNFGKDGRLTGISIGTKHTGEEPAKYVAASTDNYMTGIQKLTGLDFSGLHLRGGLGGGGTGDGFLNLTASGAKNLDPYRETTSDVKRIVFDINDPKEVNKALNEAAVHMAKMSGANEKTIEAIRNYTPPKEDSRQTQGQARSAEGVPLVGARRPRAETGFEKFAKDYRLKSHNNAV